MKKFRNSIFIILAFVFSLSFVKTSFAGEWIETNGNKYYTENGAFVTNDWREIDKNMFYFDDQGRMATSLIRIGKRYFLFHVNGVPYKKDDKVTLNGKEYDIGPRGRVINLENEINDTIYFKILAELKAKKTEEELFLSTSYASPDLAPSTSFVVPAESLDPSKMTEQEQRLYAAAANNQALADQAAAQALAAKYQILSKEYRDALLLTAQTAGIDYTSTADALMAVFVNQLNTIKGNHCNMIISILQQNPESLNIDSFVDEYEKTLKEYELEIDTACLAIRTRYSMANTPYVLMKDKFTTLLQGEKRAFREQIMSLVQ